LTGSTAVLKGRNSEPLIDGGLEITYLHDDFFEQNIDASDRESVSPALPVV